MADDPTVSNSPTASNPDIPVRATESSDASHTGKLIQHFRLDKGTGGAESVVTEANPLPVKISSSIASQDVNITKIAGNVITSGGGTSTAGTPRVILASDQTPIPAYISDYAGTPIVAQMDGLLGTGVTSLPAFGFDPSYGQFSPLPLSNAGTTVPVEVQNTITTSTYPGAFSTLANITSAASTVTLSGTGGYSGVSVSIYGTYTGVAFTLEGSTDASNWFSIIMSRQDSAVFSASSGTISNTIRSWIAPTMGALYVRARATAWASGTASVRIAAVSGAVPTALQAVQSGSWTVIANNQNTSTGGDGSSFRILDVNATATTISASTCCIGSLNAYNNTAGTVYVKLYNKTGATNADTPAQVYGIKAGETIPLNLGNGVQFKTACSVRATTGVADADNTGPAANGMVLSGSYS